MRVADTVELKNKTNQIPILRPANLIEKLR